MRLSQLSADHRVVAKQRLGLCRKDVGCVGLFPHIQADFGLGFGDCNTLVVLDDNLASVADVIVKVDDVLVEQANASR